jgi:hypothetical protein
MFNDNCSYYLKKIKIMDNYASIIRINPKLLYIKNKIIKKVIKKVIKNNVS